MSVRIQAKSPERREIGHSHQRKDQRQAETDDNRKQGEKDCYNSSLPEQLCIRRDFWKIFQLNKAIHLLLLSFRKTGSLKESPIFNILLNVVFRYQLLLNVSV